VPGKWNPTVTPPSFTSSCSLTLVRRLIFLPFSRVPLVEPRSSTQMTPLSSANLACCRERLLSRIGTSAGRARPTTTDFPSCSSTISQPSRW